MAVELAHKAGSVRVGVGAVVSEHGRVLVMRRAGSHGAGLWGLPGGHQEFGESPENPPSTTAAIRQPDCPATRPGRPSATP